MSWHVNDRPNHRCKVCGALWWLGFMADGKSAWSLRSEKCGPCCDNVAMGEQIEPLSEALEASEAEVKRLQGEGWVYDAARENFADRMRERDAEIDSLRSQLAAMTEALRGLLLDAGNRARVHRQHADFAAGVGESPHDVGAFNALEMLVESWARRVDKTLSPTSAKEWEEKVRADERERVVRSFTGPSRVAFDAALRSLAKEKKP